MKPAHLTQTEWNLIMQLDNGTYLHDLLSQRIEVLQQTPLEEMKANSPRFRQRIEAVEKYERWIDDNNRKINLLCYEAGYSLSPYLQMLNQKSA